MCCALIVFDLDFVLVILYFLLCWLYFISCCVGYTVFLIVLAVMVSQETTRGAVRQHPGVEVKLQSKVRYLSSRVQNFDVSKDLKVYSVCCRGSETRPTLSILFFFAFICSQIK